MYNVKFTFEIRLCILCNALLTLFLLSVTNCEFPFPLCECFYCLCSLLQLYLSLVNWLSPEDVVAALKLCYPQKPTGKYFKLNRNYLHDKLCKFIIDIFNIFATTSSIDPIIPVSGQCIYISLVLASSKKMETVTVFFYPGLPFLTCSIGNKCSQWHP